MADLLEIVLENISRSKVSQLLMLLLGQASQIIEIQSTEPISRSSVSTISEDEIEFFINLPGDAILMFNLRSLDIAGCVIPSVLLRLVKYGDQYDIDINFDESDVADVGAATLMEKICEDVSELAERYDIGNWFGGLEPASDENTRYFSGHELGPLR